MNKPIEEFRVERWAWTSEIHLQGLRRVNVLYADNGVGKTTVLRAIAWRWAEQMDHGDLGVGPPAPCVWHDSSADTENLHPEATAWTRVLLHGLEDAVVELLRLINRDIQRVLILLDEGGKNCRFYGQIGEDFVPISRLGYGVERLFLMGLAVASQRGGLALIDGIDQGLSAHLWADVMDGLADLADASDTQVIATTSSYAFVQRITASNRHCRWLPDQRAMHLLRYDGPQLLGLR